MSQLYDLSVKNLEELNVNDKSIMVFTHTQFGDVLMQVPMLNYLSKFFSKVYLPVPENTYNSLNIFDYNEKIVLVKAEIENNIKYRISRQCKIENVNYDYFVEMSSNEKRQFENEFVNWPWPIRYYYDRYFISPDIYYQIPTFVENIPRNLPKELEGKKYIFASFVSTDGLRKINIPKPIYDEYLVVCPDFNVYPKEHKHHKTCENFIRLKTTEYIPILENASYIYTLDHGYFWLSLLCDLSKVDLAIVIKRNYWGVKQGFTFEKIFRENSNKYYTIEEDDIDII